MDGKNQFKLKDEYGKETVYDVLFTFDNEEVVKFMLLKLKRVILYIQIIV